MDLTGPEFLEHLQRYAKTHFPEAYYKLPSVDDLEWQHHSKKPTKTQRDLDISPWKLHIGKSGDDPIWAY
jgi:hypothetical protein